MTLRRMIIAGLALLPCFGASRAWALDLDPKDIRGQSSKEPVDVLQNRYFLKAYRPEIGLIGGTMLNEAYTNTTITGVRAGMFVNEWLGFEVQGMRTTVRDSSDLKSLHDLHYRPVDNPNSGIVSVNPDINAIHQIIDFDAIAAPLYGKLNILNQAIIYTDIYFTGGISELKTDQGDKTAPAIGAGERFYIGKAWSVRLEFKDRIFNEVRGGTTSRRNAESFDFGVGYFFN